MNDHKWTKLFRQLSENKKIVLKCLIKDVGDDYIRERRLPDLINFSGTFHQTGIKDVSPGGPQDFKSIECLIFPSQWEINKLMHNQTVSKTVIKQDILKIKSKIEEIGEFEMWLNENELRLFGYR
jgi:hypothetical protein